MPIQRARKKTHITSDLTPFKAACGRLGIHYVTGYKLRRDDRFPLEVLHIGERFYCRQTDIDNYTRARAAS